MIVSKEFKWDAAHRIHLHQGKCRHLHGHTYHMSMELEGDLDAYGMVVDFNEIKQIISPYIAQLDHTTIIAADDMELREMFDLKSWKYFLLPYPSTAENLCKFFVDTLLEHHSDFLQSKKIKSLAVKIHETESSFAYLHKSLV